MQKHLLFTICSLFVTCILQAQTTITIASAYEIGDVLTSQSTDTSATEGAAGAGQAWDFSDLPKIGPVLGNAVVSVSSTGFQNLFTGSSMAIDKEGENFTFLRTTDSTMEVTGVVADGKPFVYDNSEIIFKYPFSYTSAFLDTFSGTYSQDSVSVERTGTVSFLCDANGTLILPTGVVSSTIRIKFIEKITDVAHYGNIVVTTTTNSTSYFWMIAANKNSLMKIIYTTYTANGITTETEDDSYYLSFVSTQDINPLFENVKFFPNPTSENSMLTFYLPEDEWLNFGIENLLGQKIKFLGNENYSKGKHSLEVSVDDLPAGLYLLRIDGEKNNSSVVKFWKE
jgi:hypothetical protein